MYKNVEVGRLGTWDDYRYARRAPTMTTDEERRFESQLAGLSLFTKSTNITGGQASYK